jgi:uncharacterized protein (DUF2147 family)
MRTLIALLAMVTASGAIAADALAPPAPNDPVLGKWSNPRGTIAVQTAPCREGGTLCGAIVWASEEAQADARRAGVNQLIGTQLLTGYRRTGQNSWSGTVYVPDMGRSFSSHIKQLSAQQLTISGCLISGFLCKSQVWHRVA